MESSSLGLKDQHGRALNVGDLVQDEIFGKGKIVGKCPPLVGAGYNAVIEWEDPCVPVSRGGRNPQHLEKV